MKFIYLLIYFILQVCINLTFKRILIFKILVAQKKIGGIFFLTFWIKLN